MLLRRDSGIQPGYRKRTSSFREVLMDTASWIILHARPSSLSASDATIVFGGEQENKQMFFPVYQYKALGDKKPEQDIEFTFLSA